MEGLHSGASSSVKIPQHIRLIIESLRCPKHHKHPVILIEGTDEEIKINCCCAEFKRECQYLLSKFMVVKHRYQWE